MDQQRNFHLDSSVVVEATNGSKQKLEYLRGRCLRHDLTHAKLPTATTMSLAAALNRHQQTA
jgi:hypothetical protein